MSRVSFSQLASSDLVVDAAYESEPGGRSIASEPLARLTGTGNQGGFRFAGSTAEPHLVVLYTTMAEPDWPDALDTENGLFTYFGDNRRPGFELHDRKAGRGGNLILRSVFAAAHRDAEARSKVPPFFIFSKGDRGRDAIFRGLAVPGALHLDQSSDLVAIWKSVEGQRFQNYRAIFSILDVGRVQRAWIEELRSGIKLGPHCPAVFRKWVETGRPTVLRAQKVRQTRTAAEQLGLTTRSREIGRAVFDYFSGHPTAFEHFAADVGRMMDANIVSLDVTRASRDGGRDAIGQYRIGPARNCVTVDFALEAKCYDPKSGLGVRILSRLISRLRHRQFGILVTTSFLAPQAYDELVEDEHPIVVCAGGDIAELLIDRMALRNRTDTMAWLAATYPLLGNDAGVEAIT